MSSPGKKKKTTTVVEEVPVNEFDLDNPQQPSEFDVSMESVEDAETLKDVLSQFGQASLNIKILRQTPTGAEYCYQTDAIDEEFIQKNFGGGDFQARIFINGRYRKTIKIKIASRLESSSARSDSPDASNRHSEFLEKMVLALITKNSETVPSSAPSLADLTTALSNLDNLRAKPESAMDTFMKGLEFAQSLDGKSDWKTDLIRTAKEVLPGALTAFTGVKQGEIPNHPNGVPMQLPPEAILKAGIQYAKKKAIEGMDPMLVVDWVYANREDPQYHPLIHAILNTEFSEFAKLDPEIGSEPFFSWFKPLYDGLRSAFSPTNSMDVDTLGDVGDPNHAGDHGEPSPEGSKKPKG